MEQPALETSQPTDLTASQIVKCPKPFSIESIISSNNKKDTDTVSGTLNNTNNLFDSSFYFPPNVSMANAASIYNPWIHSYFLQQQKLPENVFEMMQFGSNHAMLKEKFSEIFANNPTASVENRLFSHTELDRNVAPLPPRFIEQYFGGGGGSSNPDNSSANNEYYKHFSNYNSFLTRTDENGEPCKNPTANNEENQNQLGDKDKLNELGSEYENSVRNDDSGPDENIDDELDSDCNSEISLDMSPDGDNNTQGIH